MPAAKAPRWEAPVEENLMPADVESRSQALLMEIQNLCMQNHGEVHLHVLGETASIRTLRKGIKEDPREGANHSPKDIPLSRFCRRYPDLFQIVGLDEPAGGRVQL